METIKISELPLYSTLDGLYTVAVDSSGRSVKVPFGELLSQMATDISSALSAANTAAGGLSRVEGIANAAAETADNAALTAGNALSEASRALTRVGTVENQCSTLEGRVSTLETKVGNNHNTFNNFVVDYAGDISNLRTAIGKKQDKSEMVDYAKKSELAAVDTTEFVKKGEMVSYMQKSEMGVYALKTDVPAAVDTTLFEKKTDADAVRTSVEELKKTKVASAELTSAIESYMNTSEGNTAMVKALDLGGYARVSALDVVDAKVGNKVSTSDIKGYLKTEDLKDAAVKLEFAQKSDVLNEVGFAKDFLKDNYTTLAVTDEKVSAVKTEIAKIGYVKLSEVTSYLDSHDYVTKQDMKDYVESVTSGAHGGDAAADDNPNFDNP